MEAIANIMTPFLTYSYVEVRLLGHDVVGDVSIQLMDIVK